MHHWSIVFLPYYAQTVEGLCCEGNIFNILSYYYYLCSVSFRTYYDVLFCLVICFKRQSFSTCFHQAHIDNLFFLSGDLRWPEHKHCWRSFSALGRRWRLGNHGQVISWAIPPHNKDKSSSARKCDHHRLQLGRGWSVKTSDWCFHHICQCLFRTRWCFREISRNNMSLDYKCHYWNAQVWLNI